MKTGLVWIVWLGIWMFTSGIACESREHESPARKGFQCPVEGTSTDVASMVDQARPGGGPASAATAHCVATGAECFPEFSRWMRVMDPDPAVSCGVWHEFSSELGLPQVAVGRSRVSLLPRPGTVGAEGIRALDVSSMTLDEIQDRVAKLSSAREITATAADEDQVRELAPLGNRLVALVVQTDLQRPAVLSAFPGLRALAIRVGRPFSGDPVRLGALERLELEVPPGARTTLVGAMRDLGVSPAHLRELKVQGEIGGDFVRWLGGFDQLELLHLDWLALFEPVDLRPLGDLCRLQDLSLRGGEGLFEATWALTARLPRLRALSVVSATGEPVNAGDLPQGLAALRLEGKMSQEDLEAISRRSTLTTLALAGKGAGGVILDLEPLRRLRISRLDLIGDYQPGKPITSVRHLRWIAMARTRAMDLSSWTELTGLDLTLTDAWALKLPAARNLLQLRLQDVGERPVPVTARALSEALSGEATTISLLTDGLDQLPAAWPVRLETLRLSGSRIDDRLWTTLAGTPHLKRLFLAHTAVTRRSFNAFLKTGRAELAVVQLFDTGVAPRRSLTFRGGNVSTY
ncbi:hypothetical protein KJ975_12455 [Myxococcota bacterium]|nr:hypothetical protein [Myxococcota bacterium]